MGFGSAGRAGIGDRKKLSFGSRDEKKHRLHQNGREVIGPFVIFFSGSPCFIKFKRKPKPLKMHI